MPKVPSILRACGAIWMAAEAKDAKPYADKLLNDLAQVVEMTAKLKAGQDEQEMVYFGKYETALAPFVAERKKIAEVAVEQSPQAALALTNGAAAVAEMVAKREALEKQLAGHQPQYGITQKLKLLVVLFLSA